MNYDLEVRLNNWARWVVKITEGEIGYPKESITSYFSTYGFVPLNHVKTSSNPLNSPREEEINTVINQMALQFPQYSKAIYSSYVAKGKRADVAKGLGISTRTLRDRVQNAKIWMSAKIYA